MRLLAIKWRRLGDTVLWTSALEALRRQFPDAAIDLALPAGFLPLFASDPRFEEKFGLDPHWRSQWETARRCRRKKYDLVLNFHASRRSLALTVLARGKERIVHHHSRKPRPFFSHRRVVNLGAPMAAVERDLNVARTVGWQGARPDTKIFVSRETVSDGRLRLAADRPWVLFGASASRPAKEWPLARFARLAEMVKEKAHVGVLCQSEQDFARDPIARARLEKSAFILPTPRLGDLMGCLTNAACYVGSDSGVKHLAVALGIPTVTLFGPESLGEWHGYDESRHPVIQKPVLCRTNDRERPEFAWCGEVVCPYGSHACMTMISPEEVASTVARYL